jgi:hypothetical protein
MAIEQDSTGILTFTDTLSFGIDVSWCQKKQSDIMFKMIFTFLLSVKHPSPSGIICL